MWLQTQVESNPNFDWIAHYKNVRTRIATAPMKPKLAPQKPPELVDYGYSIGPIAPSNFEAWRTQVTQVLDADAIRKSTMSKARLMVEEICEEMGVTWNEVISPRRYIHLVRARQRICWKLKTETSWSFPQIGRFMHKDHTTVLHAIHRYELDALHKRNGWSVASSKEFQVYKSLGCSASAYLAARAGRAK